MPTRRESFVIPSTGTPATSGRAAGRASGPARTERSCPRDSSSPSSSPRRRGGRSAGITGVPGGGRANGPPGGSPAGRERRPTERVEHEVPRPDVAHFPATEARLEVRDARVREPPQVVLGEALVTRAADRFPLEQV